MIKELLAKVSAKQDLTFDEAKQAIDEIMSGEVSEAVISSFLTALAMKGETEEEIAGAATGMRSKAMEFNIGGHALDIVGTLAEINQIPLIFQQLLLSLLRQQA